MTEEYEPCIIAFYCQWAGYHGVDAAGTSRFRYPPGIRAIKVPCISRITMEQVLNSLKKVDGVLIVGCYTPSACHYVNGNYQCIKRIALLKKVIKQMGINPSRIRLDYLVISEGRKFARASVLLNYMYKSTHHQKEANDLAFQGLPSLRAATATSSITIIQSNT